LALLTLAFALCSFQIAGPESAWARCAIFLCLVKVSLRCEIVTYVSQVRICVLAMFLNEPKNV